MQRTKHRSSHKVEEATVAASVEWMAEDTFTKNSLDATSLQEKERELKGKMDRSCFGTPDKKGGEELERYCRRQKDVEEDYKIVE